MILVGGLTRLTNSGLSITEWELFKGVLPPLNEEDWNRYFNMYKKIPQFEMLNPNMNLSEFKIIFFWEYFHRILGRLIGLVFLIPLLYFHFSKKVDQKFITFGYIIFSLIVLQGIIGWYMVKSGLVNDVTVSHYRLSLHLTLALIISSLIFWMIINIRFNNSKSFFKFTKLSSPIAILILLIFFQIIIGAFVSGLDAGKIYQTWPLMGYSYFPDDIIIKNFLNLLNFESHSLVQFYHRNLAYLISFYIIMLSIFIFLKKEKNLFKPLKSLIFFFTLQVFLGIFTLISGLNIYLALLHQINSLLLIFSTINLYYFSIK
tara:strand:+ start:105 stop:1055 length:951 start_codon:yes stop_codon:yes gene_type:complete